MISRTFFPHLNKNFKAFDKFKFIMIGAGFASFFIIAGLSPFLKSFFNIKGEYTVLTICILALGIPFYAMSACFGTNYFLVKRKDSLVMKNTVVASITGFILAFPLIITFSGVGAAINLTFSRGIMGLGLWWKYNKFNKK
jgi:PST family polysaccharide transporter